MKVKATRTGFIYHLRRREGDVFTLKPIKGFKRDENGVAKPIVITPEQQFSSKWMERVDERVPERISTAQQEINKKHDEIMAERGASVAAPAAEQQNDEVI